jgi:DNA-directed RNA polymerase specialized sigma24 family protein
VLSIAGGQSGGTAGDGEPGVPPRRAFDSLHERLEKVVLGYIRARLNERDDPADADDIAQDAWEAVRTGLAEYNPARAPFHAWVKQQALYAIRRYGQRKEYRRKVEVFDTEEEGEAIDLPAPDWGDAAEGYARLLAALGRSSSPPHQIVAFGFCKLLGWPPRRIAAELSAPPLADLVGRLEDGYLDTSRLPEWLVQRCLAPLQDRMTLRFAAAVTDRKTLATYPSLHDRIIGATTFTDYYTDEPTADITQWWWAVKRRVLSDVLGGSR